MEAGPGSPRTHHHVPSSGAAFNVDTAPASVTVQIPETSLIDVVLVSHCRTLALFAHLTGEAEKGNEHTMELLAGAVAIDLRLHSQALSDVLLPLVDARCGAAGRAAAGFARERLALVEGDVLELLTLRRQRSWRQLAAQADISHQRFAQLARGLEARLLPLLAAAAVPQEEWATARRLFQQRQLAAPLAPQIRMLPGDAGEGPGGKAAAAETAGTVWQQL